VAQLMRKIHIALAVADIDESVADYSARLAMAPVVIVPGEYALWRTETINLSIRRTIDKPGTLRHLGWEDCSAGGYSAESDCNGIVWERFSCRDQEQEIKTAWPAVTYSADQQA
jgi:hypothetical protein